MNRAELNQSLGRHELILFDYDCNFCNYWVQFIIKRDKSFIYKFAPLQSKTAQILDEGQDLNTIVLYNKNKKFKKSEAVLKIASNLGFFFKIVSVVFGLVPKVLRDAIYNIVARNRSNIMKNTKLYSLDNKINQDRFFTDN